MKEFEILVPESEQGLSSQEPKYAAMFLERLSEGTKSEVLVEVSGGMVTCGERPISELLTTLLRARKFDQFLAELNRLLFAPLEPRAMGTLACSRDGQNQRFSVEQVKPMPGLKLMIRRVTQP